MRVSEQCIPALDELRDIEADTGAQEARLDRAVELVEEVADDDRRRNGPGPTDKLIAHIDEADECPVCGDPIDEGGWCGWECMQEDLDDP